MLVVYYKLYQSQMILCDVIMYNVEIKIYNIYYIITYLSYTQVY